MQAAERHVKLYACSVGQSSYDSDDGAVYLMHLLTAARAVASGARWKTVAEAHSEAKTNTILSAIAEGNEQKPHALQPKLPPDSQLILSIK